MLCHLPGGLVSLEKDPLGLSWSQLELLSHILGDVSLILMQCLQTYTRKDEVFYFHFSLHTRLIYKVQFLELAEV